MTILMQRIKQQWRFNFKTIKSVTDWTTLLYLCIPAALFAYYFYRETILQHEFGLLTYIPLAVVAFTFFFIAQTGIIRSFLQTADPLFLIQYKTKWRALTIGGLIYSFSWQVLWIGIMTLVLSPIYSVLYAQSMQAIVALMLFGIVAYLTKQLIIRTSWHEWIQMISNFLLTVLWTTLFIQLPSTIALMVSAIIFVVLFIFYVQRYVLQICYFDRMLVIDLKQSMILVSAIFMVSKELKSMKIPKEKRKRPWFFKGRLLQNEVHELIVKTLIRDKRYKWSYLRLIALTLPLYLFFPYWGQLLLFFATYFMLSNYTDTILYEIRKHPIMQIFSVSDERWQQSAKAVKNAITYIGIGIVVVYYVGVVLIIL